MAGRFDDRNAFILASDPMIDRQLEIYRENPEAYVRDMPNRMLSHFWGTSPSRKISLAWLLATCLLATHRVPTASYIWKLMHRSDADGPDEETWNALNDKDLRSTLQIVRSWSPPHPPKDNIPF
jgi:hypothetical protein